MIRKFENLFPKRERIFLVGILFIGLFLRIFNISDNIFFGYDQARDAARIIEITNFNNLKIVGPETDISGVFNGPFFYYLLSPIYKISGFDPTYAAVFMVLINISGAIVLYYFAKLLFKEEKIGLVAAFLWCISYAQLSFAKYISNASLMIIFSIIFFLGLAIFFLKNKKSGLIISTIGLGLAIQSNFYLVYLGLYYFIFYFIYKPKISFKLLVLNGLILLSLLSTFLVAEFKWGFQASKSLLLYAHGQGGINPIIENFSNYIQKLAEAVYYSFFSFNLVFAFLLLITLLLWHFKKMSRSKELLFLYILIFSTLPLFAFSSGVLNVQAVNTTIYGPLTLFFSYSIFLLWKGKNRILGISLLLIIIFANMYASSQDGFRNVKLFSGESYLMKDYKNLVNYTYQNAHGKEFSVCTVTAPLFINTLWGYLFNGYGKNTFGYVPYWSGPDQGERKNLLPHANKDISLRFLIIQDDAPDIAKRSTILMEDQSSLLLEERQFGGVKVQKRKLDRVSKIRNSQETTLKGLEGAQTVINSDPRYSCDTTYEKN